MQFSRQTFYDIDNRSQGIRDFDSVKVHANFTNYIKEQGFVNLDGTEISGVEGVTSFRWKYDTESVKNKSYWSKVQIALYGHQLAYNFYSGTIGVSGLNCFGSDWGGNYPPITIFFVPTKNNGFYTISYCPYTFYSAICPTPGLISFTKDMPYASTSVDLQRYSGALGFFNNVTNEWNYIVKSGSKPGQSIYLDDRGRGILDANTALSIDTNGTKTDVKQGVCTLIKPPYNNGFLSNIYMVSTSPAQGTNDANGTDNKFFSFNGRNFYGFCSNMVVELPAN